MIARFFLVAGLTFLAASICGILIITMFLQQPRLPSSIVPLKQPVCPGCGVGGGGATAPTLISAALPDDLKVYDEWPKQIGYNSSDTVSLALTVYNKLNIEGQAFGGVSTDYNIPTGNYNINKFGGADKSYFDALNTEYFRYCEKYQYDPSKLHSCLVGTTVSGMFGSGYELFASAHLITTSFDNQLLGSAEQSINQPLVLWNWNIFPKSDGIQIANLDIELIWKSTNKSGKDILRQLWQSPIAIYVNKSVIEVGQITISSTITGLLGLLFTGFSVTWLWEQRRKSSSQSHVSSPSP